MNWFANAIYLYTNVIDLLAGNISSGPFWPNIL